MVPLLQVCIDYICKEFWQGPDQRELSVYETIIGIVALRVWVSESWRKM